jgi:hypothetical protein
MTMSEIERYERWDRIAEFAAKLADLLEDVPDGEGPYGIDDSDTYIYQAVNGMDYLAKAADEYAKELAAKREAGSDE